MEEQKEEGENKLSKVKKSLFDINVELNRLRFDMAPLSKRIGTLLKEREELHRQQAILDESAELLITDHARVRYLERMKGISIDEELCPYELRRELHNAKNGDYKVKESHIIRIQNRTIVTVLPCKEPNKLSFGYLSGKLLAKLKKVSGK